MLNQPIYNENGTIKDYSDNGLEKEKVESGINYQLLLKRLPKRQREALKMRIDGYLLKEIANKLKCSERTIKREMALLKKQIAIINIRE